MVRISVCESGWEKYDSNIASPTCLPSDPPKGYRKCIKMFSEKKSWGAAETSCKDNGGHLIKIESKEENNFLLNTFLQIPEGEVNIEAWIGLTDKKEEGNFVWTDGTPEKKTCTMWADGQPNEEDGQDCTEIANGVFWPGGPPQVGVWNDFQCKSKIMYICEKKREEYVLEDEP